MKTTTLFPHFNNFVILGFILTFFQSACSVSLNNEKSSLSSLTRQTEEATSPQEIENEPNALFISIGYTGKSSLSSDFLNWTISDHNNGNMRGIAYGNGRIVLVGGPGAGRISYSDDLGETWTVTNPAPCNRTLLDIVFVGGRFMATGWNRAGCWSNDGVTWNNFVAGSAIGDMWGMYYANNRYITVGGWTGNPYRARWSNDGLTWNDVITPCIQLDNVYYNNGRWVAVGWDPNNLDNTVNGCIAYSDNNGLAWTQVGGGAVTFPRLSGITFAKNRWIAVGFEEGAYSDDGGNNWTLFSHNLGDLQDIKFYGSKFYAVGKAGAAGYSSDGIHWIESNHANGDTYRLAILPMP